MKQTIIMVVLSLLLAPASTARAKSLDMYLNELLVQHERIMAAEENVVSAGYGLDQAWAGYLPSVDVSAQVSREAIEPAPQSAVATSLWQSEQRVSGTQLIYDFGDTVGAIDEARISGHMAETELEVVRQQLLLEGTRAYLDVLRARDRLEYALKSEERIKTQTGIEESLVERGAGLTSNVLQAKQQLAGAMALRVLAQGELTNALTRFRTIFEPLDEETLADMDRPLPPFNRLPDNVDTAVQTALDSNLEVVMALQQTELAKTGLDRAQAGFFPELNAFGEWVRRENDGGYTGVRYESRAGIELSWTIFNGGANLAAVREARSQLRRMQYVHKDLTRSVEESVRIAWENLLTFRANSEYLKNQANILGEFLDIARRERTMGARTLLDVLSAETAYINAVSNSVSAEYDMYMAAYNLMHAMGGMDMALFTP